MGRALRKEQGSGAATDADAARTGAFLLALFDSVCCPAPDQARSSADDSPWLRDAEARCVGAYAAWFGAAPDQAPLGRALQHLLACMALSGGAAAAAAAAAAESAGAAFRNLCVRCSQHLAAPEVLASLLAAAKGALAQPGEQNLLCHPHIPCWPLASVLHVHLWTHCYCALCCCACRQSRLLASMVMLYGRQVWRGSSKDGRRP
jgi:hypothetical protein